ncbi:MAG: T9SS type A sorting domain-containing protein [Bacteroidetes bacterium]|nr:T9SS type A sorting domain-containing protein [Bacteroidota bacterium]
MEPAQIKSLVDCYFWSADSGIVVGGYNPANNYQVSNSVILLTVDGGKSFTTVFKSSRTSEWCWKINFVNANTGFVSIEAWNYGVVLKTTNKGLNWSEQVFNTADDLEGIGFINENTGWIGSHDLTHETTNGSANWSLVTWGNKINRFRFISDTLGYSVGNSIYKFTQESVSVSSISEKIPEYFYLQQNFPNPFNPSTRINYELRLSGFVTLKVYDIKGSEVQELVNEKQNEGIYSAEFDGSALPSGIYYYKLTAGEFSETRKMVLAK